MYRFALALALTLPSTAALADLPGDLSDAAIADACAAAKAQDACPTCKCGPRTSTSPVSGLDERTSSYIYGVVLDVEGKAADGADFAAAHVALGGKDKLEHIGRLATSRLVAEGGFVQYDIVAMSAVMQMCPGGCDYEAVGVVHPFEVTVTTTNTKNLDDGTVEESVSEETRLVLCYEAAGGLTCASMPLRLEERVRHPAMAPGMKDKVLSRQGYKRSWKFGRDGDVAFGKAEGKLVKRLTRPEAHKVLTIGLFEQADTRGIER